MKVVARPLCTSWIAPGANSNTSSGRAHDPIANPMRRVVAPAALGGPHAHAALTPITAAGVLGLPPRSTEENRSAHDEMGAAATTASGTTMTMESYSSESIDDATGKCVGLSVGAGVVGAAVGL